MVFALFLASFPLLAQRATGSPRDFDFWAGQWAVQNRYLQADGRWQDGDSTRARITPVLDGAALVEEWAGPFRSSFMNGFGRRQGRFRHGRGNFLSPLEPTPGKGQVQRYTFSDALEETARWDSANSANGGSAKKTHSFKSLAVSGVRRGCGFRASWPMAGHGQKACFLKGQTACSGSCRFTARTAQCSD